MRQIAGEDYDRLVAALHLARENDRGLFMIGVPGCGKTQALKAVHAAMGRPVTRFVYTKASSALGWLWNHTEFYCPCDVFLDEIGAEEIYREYGNVCDVVGDFIQRYHARRNPHAHFYGTTNLGLTKPLGLTTETIQSKYGARVVDRILELCVIFQFKGASKRVPIIAK